MISLPHKIERAIRIETKRRMDQELCKTLYEVTPIVTIPTGLYYWQWGDELDKFNWVELNCQSELKLEEKLYPMTRYRVKKLIKSILYLDANSISFGVYLFLCYRFNEELFNSLDTPFKITQLLDQYINGEIK